jgi:hypothetical protein
MPVDPREFQNTFRGFSDLFAEIARQNISVGDDVLPAVLAAVSYCVLFPPQASSAAPTSHVALKEWQDVLQEKRGQVITQDDVYEWIKKLCPDPVQATRIRTFIENRIRKSAL